MYKIYVIFSFGRQNINHTCIHCIIILIFHLFLFLLKKAPSIYEFKCVLFVQETKGFRAVHCLPLNKNTLWSHKCLIYLGIIV